MTELMNDLLRELEVEKRMCDTLPRDLVGGNENILPARSEVVNPTARYVVVNEELALVCPALGIFRCSAVPSLKDTHSHQQAEQH